MVAWHRDISVVAAVLPLPETKRERRDVAPEEALLRTSTITTREIARC